MSSYRHAVRAALAARPDLRARAPLDGLRHAARTLRSARPVCVGPIVVVAALLFDPRDLWVGLYVEPDGEEVSVYACLLPALPLRLVVTGRDLYDAQHPGVG